MSREGLLRRAGGGRAGAHDGQGLGQPLLAGAAVSGLAEDQALLTGPPRQPTGKAPHGRTLAKREPNPGQVFDNRCQ